jgi:hypothetical protein
VNGRYYSYLATSSSQLKVSTSWVHHPQRCLKTALQGDSLLLQSHFEQHANSSASGLLLQQHNPQDVITVVQLPGCCCVVYAHALSCLADLVLLVCG